MQGRFAIFFLLLGACAPQQEAQVKTKKATATTDADVSQQGGEQRLAEEPKPPEKVDAAKLRIFNLSVGKLADKGKKAEIISYSISGKADYAFWRICPMEQTFQECPEGRTTCSVGGECVENVTPYNRVVVPKLFEGKVLVSVKGCVEPDKATSREICGTFADKEYQPGTPDLKLRNLYQRRQDVIKALEKLGRDKYQIFVEYRDDLQFCLEHNADVEERLRAKIRIIDQLLKTPVNWFIEGVKNTGQSIDKALDGIPGIVATGAEDAGKYTVDGLDWLGDQIDADCDKAKVNEQCVQDLKDRGTDWTEEQINEYCTKGTVDQDCVADTQRRYGSWSKKDVEKHCTTYEQREDAWGDICSFGGILKKTAKQFASAANPVHSVGHFAEVIRNLDTAINDPEKLATRKCQAEVVMAKKWEGFQAVLGREQEKLQQIDAELETLGEF
ncbi:MAG: hypothetical protein HYW48_12660 [Deltaproteobacteria bacterium]|nr:hypothetical protein [Deltaproteobacteria bacterium]